MIPKSLNKFDIIYTVEPQKSNMVNIFFANIYQLFNREVPLIKKHGVKREILI